jgi:outer membrane protein insertion porin family
MTKTLIKIITLIIFCLVNLTGQPAAQAQEEEASKPILNKITIEGNNAFSTDTLLKELPFTIGTIYSRPLVLEGKYYLSNYYTNHGYKYVQVTHEALAEETSNQVNLIYHLNEGPITHIGNILIQGNTKTDDNVILRELLFKPGDLYRRKDIFESQSRLLYLNFFEEVRIEEAQPESTDTTVDFIIKVVEKNTGMLSFGGGFSTEEGIRGYARYRQSNLFGEGQQLSAGVKWAEKGQTYQRSREIRMDFFDPHFLDSDIGLGTEDYYRRENLDNYDIFRLGGSVYLTSLLTDAQTKGTVKFRVEKDKTFNISNKLDEEVIALEDKSQWITMFSANLTRDTRNNIISPSMGHIYSFDAGLASEIFGGDINMLKLGMEGQWYMPVKSPDWVLALRASTGYVEPFGGTNEVPIYERLFAGGADSVRGFKERYLGPKDLDGYPSGGRFSLIYNAELRFPVYKSFGGVVFYDAGNIWKTISDFDPSDIKQAVGAGIRYQTPIGPLRFDYGIELPQENNGRFHFSVGQTF